MLKALLFSGGMDSTAIAWKERPDLLVFVDYGQLVREGEQRAASAIADAIGLPLRILRADFKSLGAGPLAGTKPISQEAPEAWPFRNQMLITAAAMGLADTRFDALMIGTVKGDAVHLDGTLEFLAAMNALLKVQGGPELKAPAIAFSAQDLLIDARLPLEIAGWTFSCHAAAWACGQCRGCIKHSEAMRTLTAGSARNLVY